MKKGSVTLFHKSFSALFRRYFTILFILSASFSGTNLYCQNFPFREYAVSDGLPQSQILDFYQDSRGYIWVTTRNGISCFDGIEFRNYFRKDGLPSNILNKFFEDREKNLWVVSPEGFSKFNGRRFETFPLPDSCRLSPVTVFECPNDTILFLRSDLFTGKNKLTGFRDGICFDLPGSSSSLDTIDIRYFFFDNYTRKLVILSKSGDLWSGNNNSYIRLSDKKFSGVNLLRDRYIIVGQNGEFEFVEGRLSPLDKGSFDVYAQMVFNQSGRGNYIDYYSGGKEYNISLPLLNITGSIVDNENNLWIKGEKNIYMLVSTAFSCLTEKEGLAQNIWSIAADRSGHIWFGSLYGDLQEYDGKEFRLRNEYMKSYGSRTFFYKGSRTMSDGTIWFSTNTGVLIRDGNSFTRLKDIPDNRQICIIYEDPVDKSVLIGSDSGLYHIKNREVFTYPQFNGEDAGVVEGIIRDDNGVYWLSGEKGLTLFDGTNFKNVTDTIIPGIYTFTLVKDPRGGIWITSEEGLFFHHKTTEKFRQVLPASLNKPANSLIMIDTTHVLVGRVTDLCLIDLQKFYNNDLDYFRIYDKSDGFMGNDCLDNGIIRDINGFFWILTSDRVVMLDPEKLKQNLSPPKLHFTGIECRTDSLTWEPVAGPDLFYGRQKSIRIRHDQNTIRFSFTGISMTNPEKVTYQWRLAGYEEKWTDKSRDRSVVYEKLPPGNYTFYIKAFNADGIHTPDPVTMGFRVVPAFWQKTGFRVIFAMLVILLISWLVWLIMKRYNKKRAEEEQFKSQMARLQMNAVIRQFDPHFTFNVISSVGSLILKGEKEAAYDCVLKLSNLLRSILSDGSLIIKPLSEELDFVRKYLELQKLRFRERFDYSISVDGNVDLKRNLPKMTIQTFVDNAVKHGIVNRKEGGMVHVKLEDRGEGILITVTDNGPGRAVVDENKFSGTGQGLGMITSLFEFMDKFNVHRSSIEISDINDDGPDPAGTEVRVYIPDDYQFIPNTPK
ncbi:MAG: histidine kinase [Bacteroidales bacterium]|nr:histidine kinase [Bacteroidales bacterium]